MVLLIKDAEADAIARELAAKRKVSITEVVRQALIHEMELERNTPDLAHKINSFVENLHREWGPPKGPPADKDFYDWLGGEES